MRIRAIATRGELDEFEQKNIEEAMLWAHGRAWKANKLLTQKFICDLHRHMFGEVWKWAGSFRQTQKNIGTDYWLISQALTVLLDDAAVWMEGAVYPPDELVIRIKHRIVSIHCFSNGNGRHSRLLADLLIEKVFRRAVFTWGAKSYTPERARQAYIHALKQADQGEMQYLVDFARS